MAPKKLSSADRQEILTRYRQPEENTVTIANSYGVSTSTISRILKQNLSEEEYESLIQQKRSGTHKPTVEQVDLPGIVAQAEPAVSLVTEAQSPQVETKPVIPPPRRRQRRSIDPISTEGFASELSPSQLELTSEAEDAVVLDNDGPSDSLAGEAPVVEKLIIDKPIIEKPIIDKPIIDKPIVEKSELEEIEAELGKRSLAAGAELSEDLEDEDLEDEDLEDEDLDADLDEGDDLDDEDDLSGLGEFSAVQIQKGGLLQVLPLSEATIPKTCYVVVDRLSELITRPLKDFADLGQIPDTETQEKTLPIFDNHRIAKRFTRRMQRVVKVPDGRMLQKVRPYLEAKGITRLLIDGQVYSL